MKGWVWLNWPHSRRPQRGSGKNVSLGTNTNGKLCREVGLDQEVEAGDEVSPVRKEDK